MRRLFWMLAPLALFGCARPEPPAADVVQPDARPAPAPEPVPAPEPEPEGWEVAAPEDGAVLPADQPVSITLSGTVEADRLLVFVDSGDPGELDPSGPVDLGQLGAGHHVVRIVPETAEGLSLEPGRMLIRAFTVGEAEGGSPYDGSGPILTVGQPRGTVTPAESGEVALELRVDGAAIGEESNRVVWRVDDSEPQELREFPPPEPQTLGPFEPGTHTLVIELVDKDGKPLENGGLTEVERIFTVPEQEAAG